MKKALRWFLILAPIAFAASGCEHEINPKPSIPLPLTERSPYDFPLKIGTRNIFVKVVDTETSRAQGLSGSTPLTDMEGMLFDFTNSSETRPSFWMKDMLFDIDIVWIRNHTVVDISPGAKKPLPRAPAETLPLYTPKSDIDHVLEVRSGFVRDHNITIGTPVKF